MKEMRFPPAGGEWRVALALHPARHAIVHVAADQSGGRVTRFRRRRIREADERLDRHRARRDDEGGGSRWRKTMTR